MSVASSAASAGVSSAKGTPSVLVVEDDPGLATQLVRGLSRGGYRVDHVMTGQEALASGDPDVVPLDLGLPDVNDLRGQAGLARARGVLGGRATRWLLLAASIAGGLLIAAMTVHLAGPWAGYHHPG
jgi:CheY-like chemotaxis protein